MSLDVDYWIDGIKMKKILFLAGVVLLSGCEKKSKEVDLVTFNVKGEVVAIDRSARKITITHEEIPNFMTAMTMAGANRKPPC